MDGIRNRNRCALAEVDAAADAVEPFASFVVEVDPLLLVLVRRPMQVHAFVTTAVVRACPLANRASIILECDRSIDR